MNETITLQFINKQSSHIDEICVVRVVGAITMFCVLISYSHCHVNCLHIDLGKYKALGIRETVEEGCNWSPEA